MAVSRGQGPRFLSIRDYPIPFSKAFIEKGLFAPSDHLRPVCWDVFKGLSSTLVRALTHVLIV